ncbi:MAG: tryptophan--tRNA ligase [Rhodospirillaceae bacterium]|nr:tryptophan--tRNA ligase [Rhodospirillaceae bacterium]|tara:strand:+ start:310 stop:1308 length:999 start_codon:yes stop_codon:yes gene_type:complete
MSRIFSGIQPSGNLQLGNYLGAIRNWASLQYEYECIFCVVDLHAITLPQDPETMRQATREVAAGVIAGGVNPEKCIIFNQSQVPEHAELAWLFNCVARLGWLNRMTQFKEKAGKDRDGAFVGLYTYPVLQAADILAYKATDVPVGEDQKQHIELSRDIAQAFNSMFEVDFFPLPEARIQKEAARIMSLRDGSRKMSKSDPSDYSRINMTDGPDEIAKKIRRAKTDAYPLPENLNGLNDRPEALNLLTIYAALSNTSIESVVSEFSGHGFGEFKNRLSELAVEILGPIGEKMQQLMNEPDEVDKILSAGVEKARSIATPIVREAQKIVGFLEP